MKNMKMNATRRPMILAATMLALATLSACSTVPYRCPLDPNEKPESATACKNMHEALNGAKRGTGGNMSVFLDDKGRIVPREIMENRAAEPLANKQGTNEPFYPASGQPVFQQPKEFKAWTPSYQDAEGNLHDSNTAWFITPGRWTRGSMDQPGSAGENMLRPAAPNERPKGKVVATDSRGNPIQGQPAQARPSADQAKKDADAAALKSLSQAANSSANKASAQPAANPQAQSAPGVTAPAVLLGN